MIKKRTRCIPAVNGPCVGAFASPSVALFLVATEKVDKPIDKNSITACDVQMTVPLSAVAVTSLLDTTEVEATFAVNDAGQVSPVGRSLIGMKFNDSSHKLYDDRSVINEHSFHAERLSVLARKGCDSLTPRTKAGEGDPKSSPRHLTMVSRHQPKVTEIGTKRSLKKIGGSFKTD